MDAAKKKKEKPRYHMGQNVLWMLKAAWNSYKPVIWLCLMMIVLMVGGRLTDLFIAPVLLSKVEGQAALMELLGAIGFFALLKVLIGAVYSYAGINTLCGRVEVRTGIIKIISRKAASTSYPNLLDTRITEMQNKASEQCSGNSEPTEAIWQTLIDLCVNLIGFGVYLTFLTGLSPWMAAAAIVPAVAGFLVNRYASRWGYEHREESERYVNRMYYLYQQARDRRMGKDIRIFGMKEWLTDIMNAVEKLYQSFKSREQRMWLWVDVADLVGTLLRSGVAYALLIALALKENLSASEFLFYFGTVTGFASWVTGLLNGVATLNQQSIGLSAVREYLDIPEPFLFETGKALEPKPQEKYEIRLDNVSFRYQGAEKDTIHRMNLTIRPGEKLAIVGLNGAGKTTLVKLICGFLDPSEGRVLLNGQDIRQYNREDYYRHFSAVFQDFSILSTTVREAVAQQTQDIDMARVEDSIEKAGLTERVSKMPHGYDSHLTRDVFLDGVELSGGETQRLMLARALYKNAPVIVLDEPTAALDPIAENDLYMKYSAMTEGRTSIYISHRLASTRFCDRILMLENGGIAEEGTHDGLMKKKGKYAELFDIQSHYYREGGEQNEKE